ncbi:mevalonate kinase [Kitasatospora sp. NPDC094011]|uniref:mevalonate kinase n=1 Tax=Kitasatospora sp. NPDC094011 TaxID=3364090 RepID=UPI003830EB4C
MPFLSASDGTSKSPGVRPVGTGRAWAKVIVLGEHAVVHGAPALALPVPQLTVTATARNMAQTRGGPDVFSFTPRGCAPRPPDVRSRRALRRMTSAFRTATDVPKGRGVEVDVDCAIPVGRGLGSSAACARAVVHALCDLFDRALTPRQVFDLVQVAERVTHGRASGVDAMAVGASAPLLFQAGRAHEPTIGWDGRLIVADSGAAGRTKDAVDLLDESFRQRPGSREAFVRKATTLTQAALLALSQGRPEGLGEQLTAYHRLLRASGLSTERTDGLVDAALGAGSLGAKITGGGLGGCVIALVRREQAAQVTRRLLAAGAARAWSVPLTRSAGHDR